MLPKGRASCTELNDQEWRSREPKTSAASQSGEMGPLGHRRPWTARSIFFKSTPIHELAHTFAPAYQKRENVPRLVLRASLRYRLLAAAFRQHRICLKSAQIATDLQMTATSTANRRKAPVASLKGREERKQCTIDSEWQTAVQRYSPHAQARRRLTNSAKRASSLEFVTCLQLPISAGCTFPP